MEGSLVKAKKGDQMGEDMFFSLIKELELEGDDSLACSDSKFKRLVRKVRSKHTLILNAKKLQTKRMSFEDPFLQRPMVINNVIPKHIVCLDERYLRRCLELLHMSAARAATYNTSQILQPTKMGLLSDDLCLPKCRGESMSNLDSFVIECPLAVETDNSDTGLAGQWIIGSVTRSQSMINILNSPLFHKYGTTDSNDNLRSMTDTERPVCSDIRNSPGLLSINSPETLKKKPPLPGHHRFKSEMGHRRLLSISSTKSSYVDQSSTTAASKTVCQGMLQCTWKFGVPQYVFSVDNQRETFVANLLKADSSDDKPLEYIYLFHSGLSDQRGRNDIGNESNLVGKMKVSNSYALCPNNTNTKETEFVLFGADEDSTREAQSSNHTLGKGKAFVKKVANAFRSNHASNQSFSSKIGETSTVIENCSWEPSQDGSSNQNQISLTDDDLPPHLELAAIVVKEHPRNNSQKVEGGGWGLKFLKKFKVKHTEVSSDCCLQSADGSSSIDIIVPAGFHGGPRKMNGGPSGLIQRWRSGGSCDCGGWDIGCPLTILNAASGRDVVSPHADAKGDWKSLDLFKQGSDQSFPTYKMVNVHDGLYYLHFRSNLSALQSFSIAVAILHSRSSTLRQKNIKQSK